VSKNRKHPARPRTPLSTTVRQRVVPLPSPEPPRATAPLALQRTTVSPLVGARAAASPLLSEIMSRPRPTTPSPRATPPAAAPTPVLTAAAGGPLQASEFSCAALDGAQPRSLAVTYTFEAAEHGEPYPVHLVLQGRRVLAPGTAAGPTDTFAATAWVDRVHPGSGRVSLTTRVKGVPAGQWEVTARPDPSPQADPRAKALPAGSATTHTGFEPVLRGRAPGVRMGAWPTMVALGAVAGVALQLTLAHRAGLSVPAVLLVSVLACVLGVVGAKVYAFALEPRGARNILTTGMCVQGFVLAAITTTILGSRVFSLPLGELLDVTAPALLTGMAIGRIGCLLGGCCAGRPTASRWGIWASDRSLGTRRLPVQLVESAMAALLALATAATLLLVDTPGRGTVFLFGLAAYTLGRQLLFGLRSVQRRTRSGRPLVGTLAVLAMIAAVLLTFA
jgi:phosphatidylglycerol:prolipoprotein diacylglycerol transferase